MFNKEKGNDIMKKYTQEDLDGFKIVVGSKIFPSGDYTEIKEFGDNCKFSNSCEFGNGCRFENSCNFGNSCTFGNDCRFDECCELGSGCNLGDDCEFCDSCKLGSGCRIGNHCVLGNDCGFGYDCEFGDYCNFGNNCKFEELCQFKKSCNYEDNSVVNGRFMSFKNIGSKNREAYLYIDKNEKLFLRAGCFFGCLEEFNQHCVRMKVSQNTRDEYLYIFESAKNIFEIRNRK